MNIPLKLSLMTAACCAPLAPAYGNEISISLRAIVEPRCQIVNVVSLPDEQIQGLEVSVLCNAPNYRLSVLGENGPLPVEIRSSSETESSVKAVGSSILVSAKQPGLQVLDLEFQGGLAGANGIYRIQLDGF